MKDGLITVTLKIGVEITLWEAIKLRIAGKGYELATSGILQEIKERVNKGLTRGGCTHEAAPLNINSPFMKAKICSLCGVELIDNHVDKA